MGRTDGRGWGPREVMTRAFSPASTLSAHLTTSRAYLPHQSPEVGIVGTPRYRKHGSWCHWEEPLNPAAQAPRKPGLQHIFKEALLHPPGPWKAVLDRHPITTQQRPEWQNSDSQHSTGGGSLITVLPWTQGKRLPGQRPTQLFSLTVSFWPPRGAQNHLAATVLTAFLCFQ